MGAVASSAQKPTATASWDRVQYLRAERVNGIYEYVHLGSMHLYKNATRIPATTGSLTVSTTSPYYTPETWSMPWNYANDDDPTGTFAHTDMSTTHDFIELDWGGPIVCDTAHFLFRIDAGDQLDARNVGVRLQVLTPERGVVATHTVARAIRSTESPVSDQADHAKALLHAQGSDRRHGDLNQSVSESVFFLVGAGSLSANPRGAKNVGQNESTRFGFRSTDVWTRSPRFGFRSTGFLEPIIANAYRKSLCAGRRTKITHHGERRLDAQCCNAGRNRTTE